MSCCQCNSLYYRQHKKSYPVFPFLYLLLNPIYTRAKELRQLVCINKYFIWSSKNHLHSDWIRNYTYKLCTVCSWDKSPKITIFHHVFFNWTLLVLLIMIGLALNKLVHTLYSTYNTYLCLQVCFKVIVSTVCFMFIIYFIKV